VLILGVCRGDISPKSYIPQNSLISPKKTFVSGKSQLLVQRRAFSLSRLHPRPLNRGSAPGPRWGNSPQTTKQWRQSIGVHGVRTSQLLAVWCQNSMCKCAKASSSAASGGLLPPNLLPELCPWTSLGDFRSSASRALLAALSGSESLCFSTVVYSWLDDTDKICLFCLKCTKFDFCWGFAQGLGLFLEVS